MPIDILMPALSPTMTEGNLAKWLKKEGDSIKAGEAICEIETDKATMEVEAVDEGVLLQILVPGGSKGVKVNAPIALLRAEGEAEGERAPVVAIKPAVAVPAPAPVSRASSRVVASPLAKRLAAAAGLDLAGVTGSGPRGRIIKHDVVEVLARGPVQRAVAGGIAGPAPVSGVAPPASAVAAPKASAGVDARAWSDTFGLKYRLQANSGMRKVIARRLTEAKQTIPHFYLSVDVDLEALLKVRAGLNAKSDGYKLSVNDFVIRAVSLALRKVPAANSAWTEENVLLYDQVDVSVAVATPAGLITPIIKAADTKGLAAISTEMKELAGRARDGKLKPEEFQGGTFTISNLGMFGVSAFSAIINPPQACILAVAAGEQRAVVRDGALAIATVMTCTLSVDHRVVDGAVGAQFLAAFKTLLEEPMLMLL